MSQNPRNVQLRFFLGPACQGILKSPDEIMDEYPVIFRQLDYRFEIYGQPKDISRFLKASLLVSDNFIHANTQPEEDDLSSSSHFADSDSGTSSRAQPKETTNDISTHNASSLHLDDSSSFDPCNTNQTLPVIPLYSYSKINRTPPLPMAQRKTDFDLTKGQMKQSIRRWSLVIILCMKGSVAHYLLHRTGGFTTYLAGCQNLLQFARQGGTREELLSNAKSVGLSVAISKEQLPNSDETSVWLKVWDMDALEDIITGITTDLTFDAVYNPEVKSLSADDHHRRSEWDLKLQKLKGTTMECNDKDVWLIHGDIKRLEGGAQEGSEGNVEYPASEGWGFPESENDSSRTSDILNNPCIIKQNQRRQNLRQYREHIHESEIRSSVWDISGARQRHLSEYRQNSRLQSLAFRAPSGIVNTTSQSIASFFSEDE
ncbi:hypothetical protein BGZ76_010136 [Entomortierella beljakovae]|nr:hypothetical protein BGZ76_010136 [Entomortierella beljakovae]